MSSKHLHTTHPSAPAQADDLKRIHGIGPAIESHLYDVGVQTYEELAALSPGELAKLLHGFAGLSAQQIARHGWIGQARELAEGGAKQARPRARKPRAPPALRDLHDRSAARRRFQCAPHKRRPRAERRAGDLDRVGRG